MENATIRPATSADLDAINRIYNYFVLHSTCTYAEEPESPEQRRQWFAAHGPKHPVTVAQIGQEVVGWGALSPFHPRSAYRHSVEDSLYVDLAHQRRGIGRALLADLLQRARSLEHHVVIALIDAQQAHSIRLHAQQGFVEVGRLHEVGFKFGRWLDVCYMERRM